MITFKEYLTEAFNNPYKWEWRDRRRNYSNAEFTHKNGQIFEIQFIKKRQDDYEYDGYDYEILFGDITDDDEINLENTKFGDPLRVLATVFDVVSDFIKNEDPRKLFFSASTENKRSALYNKMIKNLATKIEKLGYREATRAEIRKSSYGNEQDYVFVRINL